MDTMKHFISILLTLILTISLAGCGQDAPAPSADTYNTIAALSQQERAALEQEALAAAELCAEVYATSGKGSTLNITLSEETVAAMVNTMGDGGYPVIAGNGELDMRNPELLTKFGEAVRDGTSTEAAYYTVQNDGTITASFLTWEGGTGEQIALSLKWNEDGRPVVYDAGKYALTEVTYTDKGWLIYARDISGFERDKKFNICPYTMVRVTALDSTCRELSQKYLEPVGYWENNLFTSTWSETDFRKLDFNCLFPILYGMYYDTAPLIYLNSHGTFDLIEGTAMHLIPQETFEDVVCQYLPISREMLFERADYCDSLGGYYLFGWHTGYYSVSPRLPEPEVTDWQYNADGTLTMTVDAVYPWYGTDCAFTHELTIRETGSGFQYVSNTLYPDEDNLLPNMQLAPLRKAEILRFENGT